MLLVLYSSSVFRAYVLILVVVTVQRNLIFVQHYKIKIKRRFSSYIILTLTTLNGILLLLFRKYFCIVYLFKSFLF